LKGKGKEGGRVLLAATPGSREKGIPCSDGPLFSSILCEKKMEGKGGGLCADLNSRHVLKRGEGEPFLSFVSSFSSFLLPKAGKVNLLPWREEWLEGIILAAFLGRE